MNVGTALKRIRSALNLTQAELAELTGISAAMVSYIEKGSKTPSTQTIANLISVLNLTEEEFSLLAQEDFSRYDDEIKEIADLTQTGILQIIAKQHQARKALGMLNE